MQKLKWCALLLSVAACDDAVSPAPAGGGGTNGSGAGSAADPRAGMPASGQAGATSGAGGLGTSVGGGTAAGSGSATPSSGSAGLGGGGATSGMAGSAGTGATPESPPGFFSDGYLMSGPWLGWVFTYTDGAGKGTTVSPVCDSSGCNPAWGAQACLRGTVAKDAASATFVGLAFHNNNPMSGGTGTWVVAGQGVYVSMSTPPPGARVQLQEPNTSTNDQRYCAALPAGGTGLIPFTSFETYCWGDPAHPSKTLTVGTEIHETAIVVPGNAVAETPFDFCLVDIGPK